MIAAALVASALALVAAPQQPRETEAAPVFPSGTQAVVLDVVAKDKAGRTVRDLRRDEIEVLEEGRPQQLLDFRFVERASPPVPARPDAPARVQPSIASPRHPTLVTLVFDSLDVQGRVFARNAALELVRSESRPDLLFSVFYVGNRLRLMQQFTTDKAAVAAAIDRACSVLDPRGEVPGSETTDRVVEAANRANDRAQSTGDVAMAGGGASSGAAAGQAASAAGVANLELRAVEMAQNLERSQRGNGSLFALFALARQQQRLAGRKAIVYFSEGLEVPNQLEALYRSVVSEANRAQLSVYPVDARGLLTMSGNEATRRDLLKSMETVRRQVQSRGGRAVTREDVLAGEVAEDAITQNVQGMLGSLAESTGGRLIANSNDVRTGLGHALDDLAGYYEVTYDPKLLAYDGSFRRVSVKVRRPGVTVQSREGYFALPPGEGSVDFPWELPLLKALQASPPPHDFELRASAYHFGPEPTGIRHTLVVEVPLDGLTFEGHGGTRKAHFSVLAVVRDANGAVVEHFSQDTPVEVPEKNLEPLRRGNAVFSRSFAVPPGRYRLELAVLDQVTKRACVRRSVLVVLPPRPGLALSSLAVVKRIEPVAEGALENADPLRAGANRIVPYAGEPTYGAGESLSIFLVAYTAPAGQARLTLEFSREGELVGRSSLELPAADTHGRIAYVATLPTASLAPGRYELSALVDAGIEVARERTFFTVAATTAAGSQARR